MFQRDGKGNPDNSDVRIAFQEEAAIQQGTKVYDSSSAGE
jgi:hypothetical protein